MLACSWQLGLSRRGRREIASIREQRVSETRSRCALRSSGKFAVLFSFKLYASCGAVAETREKKVLLRAPSSRLMSGRRIAFFFIFFHVL